MKVGVQTLPGRFEIFLCAVTPVATALPRRIASFTSSVSSRSTRRSIRVRLFLLTGGLPFISVNRYADSRNCSTSLWLVQARLRSVTSASSRHTSACFVCVFASACEALFRTDRNRGVSRSLGLPRPTSNTRGAWIPRRSWSNKVWPTAPDISPLARTFLIVPRLVLSNRSALGERLFLS